MPTLLSILTPATVELPMPAADGLETIHYSLALLIAVNCGIGDAFMKEYGISEDWIIVDSGEWIPVDSGEFLNFIRDNLKK